MKDKLTKKNRFVITQIISTAVGVEFSNGL